MMVRVTVTVMVSVGFKVTIIARIGFKVSVMVRIGIAGLNDTATHKF